MRTMRRLVNGDLEATIRIRLKFDGHKTVIIKPDTGENELDPDDLSVLQKAVIQGLRYRDKLEDGTVKTVTELSRQEKTERAFLFRSLSTVNLAPDIVEMILNGTEPKTLTMGKLRKGFPDDWEEQRKLFGI